MVLIDDVVPSLSRKCVDVHMRLADFDALGTAYMLRTTSTDFLFTTSTFVTCDYEEHLCKIVISPTSISLSHYMLDNDNLHKARF